MIFRSDINPIDCGAIQLEIVQFQLDVEKQQDHHLVTIARDPHFQVRMNGHRKSDSKLQCGAKLWKFYIIYHFNGLPSFDIYGLVFKFIAQKFYI